MQHPFILLNGKIVSATQPHFISTNRALRYGDGLFEGMRLLNNELLFFTDHVDRLLNGLNALGLNAPQNFTQAYLYKLISDLLTANRITSDAIIRIQVYRADEGLYEPVTDEVNFFIESFYAASNTYVVSNEGISIGIFNDWKKDFHPAMNFKTCNAQVYVMGARWKRANGFDDALILNSKGSIADATSSNVFLWRENKLITPALSEACIAGVVRKNLIAFAIENNIEVSEAIISIADLNEADELFLTNISKGIRLVKSLGEKKYPFKKTLELMNTFYSKLYS